MFDCQCFYSLLFLLIYKLCLLLARYVGLSSSGITFKSGTASFSSSNSERYGGFGNNKDSESFNVGYKEDEFGEDKYGAMPNSKKKSSRNGRFAFSNPLLCNLAYIALLLFYNLQIVLTPPGHDLEGYHFNHMLSSSL